MRKLASIQCLRGVAAIAVAGFHLSARLGAPFALGEAGVDVFFVISGFIMATIAPQARGPSAFLRDRFIRIAPLYWLATGAMALAALAHLYPNLRLTGADLLASLLFAPHASPSTGEMAPLLTQGWTLNYEMFFYALVAAMLLAPRRFFASGLVAALFALVLLGVFVRSDAILDFYARPIILEFAAGILIAAWRPSWRLAALMIVLALAGFAFASATVPRALGYGIPATLLVAGLTGLERAGVSFQAPPLVFLGDASYSIYLFHNFVTSLAVRVIAPPFGAGAAILSGLLGAVLLGALVYLCIERPLIAALKRIRAPRWRAPGALVRRLQRPNA